MPRLRLAQGFVADDAVVQQRLDELVSRLGSQDALEQWMAANGYVEADFRQDLRRAVQAAWMRDRIASDVPAVAEQVRARQILLSDFDPGERRPGFAAVRQRLHEPRFPGGPGCRG